MSAPATSPASVPATEDMSHRQILEALSGLLLVLFVALLSSTVVSTALPKIIGALEGLFLSHQREHEAAVRRLKEVITLEPNFWLSHHLLANALVDAGQYEAALQESAEAKRLSPLQTLSDTFGAIALARLGRTNEARAVLNSLAATARETYVPPSHFAMIEAALGNRDQAFEYLDAALSVRDARLSMLKVDPKWDALRSDPRFEATLRRMSF